MKFYFMMCFQVFAIKCTKSRNMNKLYKNFTVETMCYVNSSKIKVKTEFGKKKN